MHFFLVQVVVYRPVLAITMGDVAGIGPEILARALCEEEVWQICRPLVIGSLPALQYAAQVTNCELHAKEVSNDFRFCFHMPLLFVHPSSFAAVSRCFPSVPRLYQA